MTDAQRKALYRIQESPGCTHRDVMRQNGCRKAVIDALVYEGYVRQERPDDGPPMLFPTKKGGAGKLFI